METLSIHLESGKITSNHSFSNLSEIISMMHISLLRRNVSISSDKSSLVFSAHLDVVLARAVDINTRINNNKFMISNDYERGIIDTIIITSFPLKTNQKTIDEVFRPMLVFATNENHLFKLVGELSSLCLGDRDRLFSS